MYFATSVYNIYLLRKRCIKSACFSFYFRFMLFSSAYTHTHFTKDSMIYFKAISECGKFWRFIGHQPIDERISFKFDLMCFNIAMCNLKHINLDFMNNWENLMPWQNGNTWIELWIQLIFKWLVIFILLKCWSVPLYTKR